MYNWLTSFDREAVKHLSVTQEMKRLVQDFTYASV